MNKFVVVMGSLVKRHTLEVSILPTDLALLSRGCRGFNICSMWGRANFMSKIQSSLYTIAGGGSHSNKFLSIWTKGLKLLNHIQYLFDQYPVIPPLSSKLACVKSSDD